MYGYLLTLLSYIYWMIWNIRKILYNTGILKTRRLPYPVICIGNITTGGTGKTPAVIALAKLLQKGGFDRIAILTRGYKRRSRDPIIAVSDGNKILSTPQDAGDEPYLLASALKDVPVIVGKDRYRSGQYAMERFGADLFILDDGYQHIRLYRDLNILLIDATNPFGNEFLLPKGILREPLSAIARADCIIISRADKGETETIENRIRTYNRNASIFHSLFRTVSITDSEGNAVGLDYVEGKKLFLFCGIGNPASFKKSVVDRGGNIVGERIYPDHYWYSAEDLEEIFSEAPRMAADAIMTTEKDAVRLIDRDLLPEMHGKIKILILQVEMEIEKGFEEWAFAQVTSLQAP